MATNIVNLDALIRRADLAAPGEAGEDITSISIPGLGPKGFLYPALRKPDFQRETASWIPEQVSDLISTFMHRDLIPAVILWRAGQNVFVIDGAHRLSALIAWVHDDYGDGEVSRKYFQGVIPPEQQRAAERTRALVVESVGSYDDHQMAIDYPKKARPEIAERAARIGWQEIPVQWIRNADHERAEKSFFRINQGGTKIDPVEARILNARGSATALAARAILRGGTGHNYWDKFAPETQDKIETLGGEVHRLLFDPALTLPLKTLDVPVAGAGYGPGVLPFVFDMVNLINEVPVADSSHKRAPKDDALTDDVDGSQTINYLTRTRAMLFRLCSTHASSLGLHPALYFYSRTGVFQPAALLSFTSLFKSFTTEDFSAFTRVREPFEAFLIAHRGITEAVRKLGSGARSRPRVIAFYKKVMEEFQAGKQAADINKTLASDKDFSFLFADEQEVETVVVEGPGTKFKRDTKVAAFLRDALPSAPRCHTCQGLLHRNGIQTGHKKHRREGGAGVLQNAINQHPFCNSTVRN